MVSPFIRKAIGYFWNLIVHAPDIFALHRFKALAWLAAQAEGRAFFAEAIKYTKHGRNSA
jgi:hypothetical protein